MPETSFQFILLFSNAICHNVVETQVRLLEYELR